MSTISITDNVMNALTSTFIHRKFSQGGTQTQPSAFTYIRCSAFCVMFRHQHTHGNDDDV